MKTRSDVQKCECGLNGADGSSGLLNPSVLFFSLDGGRGFYTDEKGHEAPEEEKLTHGEGLEPHQIFSEN